MYYSYFYTESVSVLESQDAFLVTSCTDRSSSWGYYLCHNITFTRSCLEGKQHLIKSLLLTMRGQSKVDIGIRGNGDKFVSRFLQGYDNLALMTQRSFKQLYLVQSAYISNDID